MIACDERDDVVEAVIETTVAAGCRPGLWPGGCHVQGTLSAPGARHFPAARQQRGRFHLFYDAEASGLRPFLTAARSIRPWEQEMLEHFVFA